MRACVWVRCSDSDSNTNYTEAPKLQSYISSVTSQDTGNLCWSGGTAAFISAQTSTAHSLDILRAKLTLLQCVVCARARDRWSEPSG